ncbi:MAG: hypothetical protein LWW86_13570 [Micrococcales bacterium]|nr:hypothetical protein [Micrococcales bacterium]
MRTDPAATARWVERGLVAAHVVPAHGWTAVLPAETGTRADHPYDDPALALASHPASTRMRPALGFFVLQGRGAVTVQDGRFTRATQWLVWEPGVGLVRPDGLRRPAPRALLHASHALARGVEEEELRGILTDPRGSALEWLLAVIDLLGLPGGGWLSGADSPRLVPGARVAEPTLGAVERFHSVVREDADDRAIAAEQADTRQKGKSRGR